MEGGTHKSNCDTFIASLSVMTLAVACCRYGHAGRGVPQLSELTTAALL
jgi:hypothetical protein